MSRSVILATFLFGWICGAVALSSSGDYRLIGAAWADEDDSDDDEDDDEDYDDDEDDTSARIGGGGNGVAPGRSGRPAQAAPTPAPVVPVALPDFAPDEIVTLNLSDTDLTALLNQGYEVISEVDVPTLGVTSRRLRIPAGITLEAARDEVRRLPTGQSADFNHYYRAEQDACEGPHCPSRELVEWPAPYRISASCGTPVPIGVIDTGINPDHEALRNGQLEVLRITDEALQPSRAMHGTAVVALLIGDVESRSPGLVPQAEVIAIDAFYRQGRDERSDVFTLVQAMGLAAERGARVLNLSLAGPPNEFLEAAVADLTQRGVVLVAAAGNGGPRAKPAFPGAYENVIAVTAVDAGGNIYRRAGQGPHVDIAAPGVEVWTAASIRGARPKTGTSFAAPFVSAASALVLGADPNLTANEVAKRISSMARDLGDPGHDPVFGDGLLQARNLCETPILQTSQPIVNQ